MLAIKTRIATTMTAALIVLVYLDTLAMAQSVLVGFAIMRGTYEHSGYYLRTQKTLILII